MQRGLIVSLAGTPFTGVFCFQNEGEQTLNDEKSPYRITKT